MTLDGVLVGGAFYRVSLLLTRALQLQHPKLVPVGGGGIRLGSFILSQRTVLFPKMFQFSAALRSGVICNWLIYPWKVSDIGCNPVHTILGVNPTKHCGAYFRVDMPKVALLISKGDEHDEASSSFIFIFFK